LKFCPSCGEKSTKSSQFCSACGNPLGDLPSKALSNPKSELDKSVLAAQKNAEFGTVQLKCLECGFHGQVPYLRAKPWIGTGWGLTLTWLGFTLVGWVFGFAYSAAQIATILVVVTWYLTDKNRQLKCPSCEVILNKK
jgi:predicted RNA-binding Zn-ribbon protein involved in translation (DUF1610 family)